MNGTPSPPGWLAPWCSEHLGADPVESLLQTEHMSAVFGVRLADGRSVVVKARADDSGRTASCVAAQAALARQGFACPLPLTPVIVTGSLAVHAEEWRPGGSLLRGTRLPSVLGHADYEAQNLRWKDGALWAACPWTAAHNARAEALLGRPPVATAALREQAAERLARAGA